MDFLEFFSNYNQDYRLHNAIKFELLVWPTFEKISDFSMHNVYWDTLYTIYRSWDILNLMKVVRGGDAYGSMFLRIKYRVKL